MSKFLARGLMIIIDLFLLSAAYWLAFLLRFEFKLSIDILKLLFFTWPYVVIFKYLVLVFLGVPNFSWRYVGLHEASKTFFALSIATAVLVGFRMGIAESGGYFRYMVIPLGVLGMDYVLSFLGVVGVRVMRRVIAEYEERRERRISSMFERKTLLIGAGQAGVMVAREVVQNPNLGIKVVGFVDDAVDKIGTMIHGHKVLGDTVSIPELVEKYDVEQAVITMASAPGSTIRRIVGICESIKLPVKIIPGVFEILDGRVNITRIREVTIHDLLGRDSVELDIGAIGKFISGKRVLVTGAGGSIGSELCRQVCHFDPQRLVLYEQAENALFAIHMELLRAFPDIRLVPVIGDICDSERVDKVFSEEKPQVIFHAAAHKHVPMMEWNPGEAVKNNVFGTKKILDAAIRNDADSFVLISTDKAVNPASIMGASKRVAEIYMQARAKKSRTKGVAVRFGNVLGSAGSVIPIFQEQIRKGGPVTVTHAEMKRYFMTIPEACQLVMQAATMGQGGEIFVLDMGEPVKILDIAKDLIRLSGFSEDDIKIVFTGVRPGEKLFEELAVDGERITKTRHSKIFIGHMGELPEQEVTAKLDALTAVTSQSRREEVRAAFRALVPEMREPDENAS